MAAEAAADAIALTELESGSCLCVDEAAVGVILLTCCWAEVTAAVVRDWIVSMWGALATAAE